MRVTIVDFNQVTLDLVSKNLQVDIKCIKADVSLRSDWKRIPQQVGDVDFLMLNAGVTGKGMWGDDDYFDTNLYTNLNAVINGLNTYTPSFKAKDRKSSSAIMVTRSKQGIANPPGIVRDANLSQRRATVIYNLSQNTLSNRRAGKTL
jgi:NADP-dependent 3-hydroxy acid dehydrogenase YdfG